VKKALMIAAVALMSCAGPNVNGIWMAENQTFIFYQEGSHIKVMCSYRFENRQPVVWYGEGSIAGNRVSFHFHHTSNLTPSSWEDGVQELTLSPDNQTMTGTWRTVSGSASGNMQPIKRVGP
jgi:hypothetical protein